MTLFADISILLYYFLLIVALNFTEDVLYVHFHSVVLFTLYTSQ